MKKKLVALLLCLVMALSLVPTTAWAAGGGWYNGEYYHQLSKTSGTFYVGQYFGMYAGVYGFGYYGSDGKTYSLTVQNKSDPDMTISMSHGCAYMIINQDGTLSDSSDWLEASLYGPYVRKGYSDRAGSADIVFTYRNYGQKCCVVYHLTFVDPASTVTDTMNLEAGKSDTVTSKATFDSKQLSGITVSSYKSDDTAIATVSEPTVSNGNVNYTINGVSRGQTTVTVVYTGKATVGPNLFGIYSDLDVTLTDIIAVNVKAPVPQEDWTKLSVSKTADKTAAKPGEAVTYTVKVTNNTGKDLTDIKVSDTLPAGLTFVSADPTSGQYDTSTGVWTIASLEKDTSATLTINATVSSNAAAGTTITNTASITDATAGSESLPAGTGNSGSVDVTVSSWEITAFAKALVAENNVPAGIITTGISFPDSSDGKVEVPASGSVTLLYKLTVTGDVGASFTITEEDNVKVVNATGCTLTPLLNTDTKTVEGTLTAATAEIYVTRTFNNITANASVSNTATIAAGDGTTLADGVRTAGPVRTETKPAPTDEPDAPTWNDLKNMTGLVNMVCETVNSHSRTYGLLEDTYTVSEVAKNADDVYTCTVTITGIGVSTYIAKYNDDTNSKHEAGDTANDLTITLKYVNDAWQVSNGDTATINVKCTFEQDAPAAPTAKDLEGYKLVKVDCDTKISHGKKTYALLDGTFTTKVTGDGDGNFQCVITITQDGAKKYVEQYSKDLGKTHSLKKLEDATITLKYKDNSWVVDNNDNSASILANCVPTGSHSNTNPSKPSNGKPVTSQKTFDAGIALYAGLSILSLTGGALVIRKRKEF